MPQQGNVTSLEYRLGFSGRRRNGAVCLFLLSFSPAVSFLYYFFCLFHWVLVVTVHLAARQGTYRERFILP